MGFGFPPWSLFHSAGVAAVAASVSLLLSKRTLPIADAATQRFE